MGFFDGPQDVAVDRDRNIYVADTNNNRIQKLEDDGRPLFMFGKMGSSQGEFFKPRGIAVDDRFIYVADTGNHRIQIFTASGRFVLSYGQKGFKKGEFNRPIGICVGKKGQIYVADTDNHRLVELKITY